MVERIEAFVKQLTTTPGLCGAEQRVCEIMKREFTACGISPRVDAFGNCLAEIPGTDPDAPVLMIFAHMDSLGFVVKYIDEQGFLKLERVGGIPEKALVNTQVQIGTRSGIYLDGVIGLKSHHLTPPEEKYIVDKYTNLFVDIGAKSREEVLDLGIDVGSPVVYKPKFTKLLGTTVLATYLDDRGGCAALLELAHTLTKTSRPSTVWLVASVLEEYNLRGAMLAARAIRPTMAICLDGGGPHDTPDLQGTGHLRMGGGPTMDLYNFHGRGTLNGTIAHPAMVRLAEAASCKLGIPLQRQAYVGGLTDLSYVQFENGGILCLDMGFAVRYCHGPCEVSDLSDIDKLTVVVAEMANSLSCDTDLSR